MNNIVRKYHIRSKRNRETEREDQKSYIKQKAKSDEEKN